MNLRKDHYRDKVAPVGTRQGEASSPEWNPCGAVGVPASALAPGLKSGGLGLRPDGSSFSFFQTYGF